MPTREQKNEYQRKWRIKNIDAVRESARRSYHKCKKLHPKTTPNKVFDAEYHREWCKNNPDKVKKKSRDYRIRHPEKVLANERKYKFKAKYGITVDDYEKMLEKQGGKCAICESETSGRFFCVDHNHDTGKVRGLLCHSCNGGIGLLKENVGVIQKALIYLIDNQ